MYYLAVTKCCLHLVVIALCMKIAVAAKSNVWSVVVLLHIIDINFAV